MGKAGALDPGLGTGRMGPNPLNHRGDGIGNSKPVGLWIDRAVGFVPYLKMKMRASGATLTRQSQHITRADRVAPSWELESNVPASTLLLGAFNKLTKGVGQAFEMGIDIGVTVVALEVNGFPITTWRQAYPADPTVCHGSNRETRSALSFEIQASMESSRTVFHEIRSKITGFQIQRPAQWLILGFKCSGGAEQDQQQDDCPHLISYGLAAR
jgi:hypothetical protein